MSSLALAPRSAFHGLLADTGTGDGVSVQDRTRLQLATVIAHRGQEAALAARAKAAFGLALPTGPKRVVARDLAALGTGPGTWLVSCEDRQQPLANTLAEKLAGVAAISEQSDGYAVLRIAGPRARDLFAKGLDIDLHPKTFGPGDGAVTACAHINVMLWQVDNLPSYDIALFRSLAGSFWHWLAESAAEYGLKVVPEPGR